MDDESYLPENYRIYRKFKFKIHSIKEDFNRMIHNENLGEINKLKEELETLKREIESNTILNLYDKNQLIEEIETLELEIDTTLIKLNYTQSTPEIKQQETSFEEHKKYNTPEQHNNQIEEKSTIEIQRTTVKETSINEIEKKDVGQPFTPISTNKHDKKQSSYDVIKILLENCKNKRKMVEVGILEYHEMMSECFKYISELWIKYPELTRNKIKEIVNEILSL